MRVEGNSRLPRICCHSSGRLVLTAAGGATSGSCGSGAVVAVDAVTAVDAATTGGAATTVGSGTAAVEGTATGAVAAGCLGGA